MGQAARHRPRRLTQGALAPRARAHSSARRWSASPGARTRIARTRSFQTSRTRAHRAHRSRAERRRRDEVPRRQPPGSRAEEAGATADEPALRQAASRTRTTTGSTTATAHRTGAAKVQARSSTRSATCTRSSRQTQAADGDLRRSRKPHRTATSQRCGTSSMSKHGHFSERHPDIMTKTMRVTTPEPHPEGREGRGLSARRSRLGRMGHREELASSRSAGTTTTAGRTPTRSAKSGGRLERHGLFPLDEERETGRRRRTEGAVCRTAALRLHGRQGEPRQSWASARATTRSSWAASSSMRGSRSSARTRATTTAF